MKRLFPLLLLGGCATAAVAPPPATVAPAGHAVPQTAVAGPALADVLARDPAFDPLRMAAAAGSPDLAVAAARVRQARAGLTAAGAGQAPRIDASVSATRTRQSLEQFGLPPGVIDRDRTALSPGVSASWEIDLFGRLAAGRRAASARLDAATADAAGTRLSLETEIGRNLLAVRALDARIRAAAEARDAAAEIARIARIRADAGLATGLDAATAAADRATVAAAIPPLAADRAARVAALSLLSGLSVPAVEALLKPPTPLPGRRAWGLPPIPSDLLQRRPDIQAAAARLRAADEDTAAAVAARYPTLTLTGTLGWLSETVAGLFTGASFTASAGGALAAPLLDFGRTAAAVEQRRGEAAEATALYRRAVLVGLAEVEQQLAAAREARAQAEALETAAAELGTARRLADSRFRGGIADVSAVSEAQRRLADARDRQIAAEAAALDAALLLQLATGGPLATEAAPQ